MKNFRATNFGGDGGFVYTTAGQGNVIAVRVYHMKTSSPARRGVYVQVQPEEHKDGCISFVLIGGKGFSLLAVASARKNDKLTAQVAARLDEAAPQIADLFQQGRHAEARAFVQGMFEKAA